jgi:hypothetical protein
MKRFVLFLFSIKMVWVHSIEWKGEEGYCSGADSKRQRAADHYCPTKHTSSKEGENLLNY